MRHVVAIIASHNLKSRLRDIFWFFNWQNEAAWYHIVVYTKQSVVVRNGMVYTICSNNLFLAKLTAVERSQKRKSRDKTLYQGTDRRRHKERRRESGWKRERGRNTHKENIEAMLFDWLGAYQPYPRVKGSMTTSNRRGKSNINFTFYTFKRQTTFLLVIKPIEN